MKNVSIKNKIINIYKCKSKEVGTYKSTICLLRVFVVMRCL